ncbi:hypothetical protein BCR36DRAFT_410440 [Piromyces finnis]|uniref:Zinc finger protein n=1 Tax=Piromyces finnis TaxID=1754191 RepID=A0A1Y1VGI3_9FUNG|nr:hypothetical protein BCR36DRAFT_410440 [Piromyces finnis]|eukprot:ORX55525.1 hypothetical protein BCR36DRAFT_410440 [Piromyces finnis]
MTTKQNDQLLHESIAYSTDLEEDIISLDKENIKNIEKYYNKVYFNNNIFKRLTEISLDFPLKWYCPNEKCYYNKNKFEIPLKEFLINNMILFLCPKCELKLYPCQNCLHFMKLNNNDSVGYHCLKCGWLNIIDQDLIKILKIKSNSLFNIEQAVTVQCIISGGKYYKLVIENFYNSFIKNLKHNNSCHNENNNNLFEEYDLNQKKLKIGNNSVLSKEIEKSNGINYNSNLKNSEVSQVVDNNTVTSENKEKIDKPNKCSNNDKCYIIKNKKGKERRKYDKENLKEIYSKNNKNKNIQNIVKKKKDIDIDNEYQNCYDLIKNSKEKMINNKKEKEYLEVITNKNENYDPNQNENKNKRKRKRKRRTNNKIILSKFRSEFINDNNSENKFKKSLILYTIKILQTPEIIFTTVEELQKYRLLNIYDNLSLIQNKLYIYNDLNIDIDARMTINKAMNIINNQKDELNYIKSNLKARSILENFPTLNKIEYLTYGINESHSALIKCLLSSLEYINVIINQLINNIYNYNNESIDCSINWMDTKRLISTEEIKDILQKYYTSNDEVIEYSKNYTSSISSYIDNSKNSSLSYIDYSKTISSTGSIFDIFSESFCFNDDKRGKDKLNDNLLNNSKYNSSEKSSIYSSNSSDMFFSSQNPITDYNKNIINIKLFHQLQQLYSIICQYIFF